ncbi:hypothetical protein [Paraliomyxa miuraensis]|uniref:hypothetical protein n=1 Tax=Paraliomyxa miuraensis TaxID=376150 RepID=UPI00225147EE|nr:hypothetical protein [Paraliomyxa miuraensis]MCX4245293.1 hypothetical protein [Paraliomyxa miuraensis]
MNPWWARRFRSPTLLASALALLLGCGPQVSSDDDGDDDSESDSNPTATSVGPTTSTTIPDTSMGDTVEPVGWFEVGWGDGEYVPLADGDDFPIVLGGQGAQMFPMPLRGAEFYLPGNPTSWMDETGPLVDMEMDIEGYNDGPGGHFKRIANYTLDWVVMPDGSYQSSFLPIIVPDGIDPEDIEGLPAHLWVRLRPFEQPELVVELDVVVTVIGEFGG